MIKNIKHIFKKGIKNKMGLSKEDMEFIKNNEKKNILSYNEALKLYKEKKITKEEFIEKIKTKEKLDKLILDKEYNDYKNKEIAHGALDIATSAIPIGGTAKIAGKGIQIASKKLTPYVGKKIAQTISKNAAVGAAMGAFHGSTSAIIDKENPITKGLTEGMEGAATGSALGLIGGKVVQKIDGAKLKNLPQRQKIQAAKQYYSNYERGIKINNDILGKIKMTSDAYKETMKQNPRLTNNVIDLSKDIKSARYVESIPPKHEHKNYDIKKFHRLSGNRADYLIAENGKGDNYFYKVVDPKVMGSKTPALKPTTHIIPNKNTNFNKTKGINNKSDKTVNSTITDNLLKGLDLLSIKTMDESDKKSKGNNDKQDILNGYISKTETKNKSKNKQNGKQTGYAANISNKKSSIKVDFNNVSVNGKKYKDWSAKEQKAFWDGFESNSLSTNKSTKLKENIIKENKGKTGRINISGSSHWITIDHNHILIED